MHHVLKKIEEIAVQDIECMAEKEYNCINRKAFGEAVDILKDVAQTRYFMAKEARIHTEMGQSSKYGKAYEKFNEYCYSKEPEAKRLMKQSIDEIFEDIGDMVENVMKYADATDKPALKQKMVQLAQKVQQMQ